MNTEIKDKVFSMIKDKKAYLIQKSMFSFINDSKLPEKIARKEDIYKLVDNEILDLSEQLVSIFNLDYKPEYNFYIHECFESIISKSLHNTFIMAYEQDDIKFTRLIQKLNEAYLSKSTTLEEFLKVNVLLDLKKITNANIDTINDQTVSSNGDMLNSLYNINANVSGIIKNKETYNNKDENNTSEDLVLKMNKIINKFKNDFYHYQSARDKLTSINSLFYNIKQQILKIDSYINFNNTKELRRLLSYVLIKGNINRIFSNLQFIKTFKLISSMTSQETYFLNILFNSVKRLKLKLHKHYTSISANKKKLNSPNSNIPELTCNNDSDKFSNFQNGYNSSTSLSSQNSQNGSDSIDDSHNDTSIKYDKENEDSKANINDDVFSFISYQVKEATDDKKLDANDKKDALSEINYYSQTIMKINTEKTRKDYFEGQFKDLDHNRLESLSNDFKITLKLIESFKLGMKKD